MLAYDPIMSEFLRQADAGLDHSLYSFLFSRLIRGPLSYGWFGGMLELGNLDEADHALASHIDVFLAEPVSIDPWLEKFAPLVVGADDSIAFAYGFGGKMIPLDCDIHDAAPLCLLPTRIQPEYLRYVAVFAATLAQVGGAGMDSERMANILGLIDHLLIKRDLWPSALDHARYLREVRFEDWHGPSPAFLCHHGKAAQ
jgi:hypothetical protein